MHRVEPGSLGVYWSDPVDTQRAEVQYNERQCFDEALPSVISTPSALLSSPLPPFPLLVLRSALHVCNLRLRIMYLPQKSAVKQLKLSV